MTQRLRLVLPLVPGLVLALVYGALVRLLFGSILQGVSSTLSVVLAPRSYPLSSACWPFTFPRPKGAKSWQFALGIALLAMLVGSILAGVLVWKLLFAS